MIDNLKWTSTLPNKNFEKNEENKKLDSKIWISTIPKPKKENSFRKYTALSILFIFILISASITKNEARSLQKEINYLTEEIDNINYDIYRVKLEHEVLSSPENISELAKKYLETDLIIYKKSQIKDLNQTTLKSNLEEKKLNLYKNKKSEIIKTINEKKVELKQIKNIYKKPKNLPNKVSEKIKKIVNEQQSDLKNLYDNPNEIFKSKKVRKWAGIQVVKVFLGIPVVPGK